jgi:hypothetical protein
MAFIKNNRLFIIKSIKFTFILFAVVLLLTYSYFHSLNINDASELDRIFSINTKFDEQSPTDQQQLSHSHLPTSNSSHLWSIRFADDKYFRIARLLPCRTVEYTGGPKTDEVHSCDYSPANEFSIQNTIQAQKWLYEHQHPSNCSNKRFAIIQNFAPSGFGSTVHQIVWAFGMALADDRIAIYKTPGNWVR